MDCSSQSLSERFKTRLPSYPSGLLGVEVNESVQPKLRNARSLPTYLSGMHNKSVVSHSRSIHLTRGGFNTGASTRSAIHVVIFVTRYHLHTRSKPHFRTLHNQRIRSGVILLTILYGLVHIHEQVFIEWIEVVGAQNYANSTSSSYFKPQRNLQALPVSSSPIQTPSSCQSNVDKHTILLLLIIVLLIQKRTSRNVYNNNIATINGHHNLILQGVRRPCFARWAGQTKSIG